MGQGDPGREHQGGLTSCSNASARSFAPTKPRDSTAPERPSTSVRRTGSPTRCARSASTPAREEFPLSRVDLVGASLAVNGRTIEGLPLFDGGFTGAAGIAGALGPLDSDAPIGLAEIAPNAQEAGALGEARRQNRHQAIVVVTRGLRPGFCPSNADSFLHPFGPPVLQVASEEAPFLADCARQGAKALLTAQCERTQATAFNVVTAVPGTDKSLAPLVVMTPRSGWWWCASERGGGLACWLEIMRAMRAARPARDVLFVASSGHELGHLGLDAFMERRPGPRAGREGLDPSRRQYRRRAGARQSPAGLRRRDGIDAGRRDDRGRASRSTGAIRAARCRAAKPLNVHRGGGRYISIIGSNDLFHNTQRSRAGDGRSRRDRTFRRARLPRSRRRSPARDTASAPPPQIERQRVVRVHRGRRRRHLPGRVADAPRSARAGGLPPRRR